LSARPELATGAAKYKRKRNLLSVDVLYAATDHAGVDLRERFGVNLRGARLARGLTQEALGFRCELDRTEVSLLERGGREPRLETIVKLAGVLGTTPDRLCAGIAWSARAGELEVAPLALPPPRLKRPRVRRPSR
jgi:transcriptional regulator with XRE-family HTH domain